MGLITYGDALNGAVSTVTDKIVTLNYCVDLVSHSPFTSIKNESARGKRRKVKREAVCKLIVERRRRGWVRLAGCSEEVLALAINLSHDVVQASASTALSSSMKLLAG